MQVGEKVFYFDPKSHINGIYSINSIDTYWGDNEPYKVYLVADNNKNTIELKREQLKNIYPLNKAWCCVICGNTDMYVMKNVHLTTNEISGDEVNDTTRYYCNNCDEECHITTLDKYVHKGESSE
jgi:hypothetical protein